jgi:hypothetical protein
LLPAAWVGGAEAKVANHGTAPHSTRTTHQNTLTRKPKTHSFADGTGTDMTLEFMYAAPYANLYTNLHLGAASEPFGWVARGQDAAAYNTFWNVRALRPIALPPREWAPLVTWVDVQNLTAVRLAVVAFFIGWGLGGYVSTLPSN